MYRARCFGDVAGGVFDAIDDGVVSRLGRVDIAQDLDLVIQNAVRGLCCVGTGLKILFAGEHIGVFVAIEPDYDVAGIGDGFLYGRRFGAALCLGGITREDAGDHRTYIP